MDVFARFDFESLLIFMFREFFPEALSARERLKK
jgi:hypothetical protein